MLYVNLGVIALFIVLGIVFLSGRGADLIAGYNTMAEEEKAKYDERALCRFMGKLMLSLAACWAVSAAGLLLERMAFFWAGFALFAVAIVFALIYANTGGRYKR